MASMLSLAMETDVDLAIVCTELSDATVSPSDKLSPLISSASKCFDFDLMDGFDCCEDVLDGVEPFVA